MSDDDCVVRMRDVRKEFSRVTALDGVSLDLRRGQVVGLIGRNGSGKSTLLRHIPGLLRPTSGTCETFGCPATALPASDLARIGYVSQDGELVPFLTVDQHMDYMRAYYPGWNAKLAKRYRERFHLPDGPRVGTLSPGVRQQLAFVLGIAFEPELVVLDEPAAAMDPLARAEFRAIVMELVQDERRSIVLSSHLLSDVESLVDRVVMLHEGAVLRDAPLDELRDGYAQLRVTALQGALPETLPFPGVVECNRSNGTAILVVRGGSPDALQAVGERIGCRVETSSVQLDDIYRLEVGSAEGMEAR